MLYMIFEKLKTDTDISINNDADTNMVLADTNMDEIGTDISILVSVSANRYIGLSLLVNSVIKLY